MTNYRKKRVHKIDKHYLSFFSFNQGDQIKNIFKHHEKGNNNYWIDFAFKSIYNIAEKEI